MTDTAPTPEVEAMLRLTYESFNHRDVESVLKVLDDDVDWPNLLDDGRLIGHDAVREYWDRQFETIDPYVEPRSIVQHPDGTVEVEVHQVIRDRATGNPISDSTVRHVFTLHNGLILALDVFHCDGTLASAPRIDHAPGAG